MLSNVLLQQGGGGAAIFLLFIVFTVVYLALVVWVYTDAQRNSEHPAFLWAIVVFFAPLLGLVLYVLLGQNASGPSNTRSEW